METKVCFKCNLEKPLSEYYVHEQMEDGHLNKCKDCTKKDTKERRDILIKNPEWVEKEHLRQLEKGRRLGKKYAKNYKEKYPEKFLAKYPIKNKKAPDGFQRHHWSYRKEHGADVILLNVKQHNIIHRHIIYDQERMMYRGLDGVLLDTREVHENYIKKYIE